MAINSVNNLETTDKADASKPPAKRWVYVIPVAVVMYMLAYLDRTNTAMILPYINSDTSSQIHLTKADEGIVSGIFFFGYMFLQIPAAILAERWSAKKTVAILMFLWGFAAMAVSFVQSNGQFYTARFVLGFFEGGVWPSVLILIANWFPLKERARANSLWMCCLPLSSVLISPITGALLDHFSWRTVLFVEGVPPLIWAIVWLLVVSDHPHDAKWASGAEREYIEAELAADEANKPIIDGDGVYLAAARSAHVWQLIAIYVCFMGGFYGYTLWLPPVVKGLMSRSPSVPSRSSSAQPSHGSSSSRRSLGQHRKVPSKLHSHLPQDPPCYSRRPFPGRAQCDPYPEFPSIWPSTHGQID